MRFIIPTTTVFIVLLGLVGGPGAETRVQNDSGDRSLARPEEKKNLGDKAKSAAGTEKIENIRRNLEFSDEKPAILSLVKSEKINLKAVGLKKGQVMSKHKAGLRSFVIVLEGQIEFVINGRKFVLDELDTYEIPVNVEHEIRGIEQSIFSLMQEK